jgi:hypothetical protein
MHRDPIKTLSPTVEIPSFSRANVELAHYGWLSKERDTMKIPDYIAIGVLILVLVWAVADQFPRGKL